MDPLWGATAHIPVCCLDRHVHCFTHYIDVIMSAMASQLTCLTIVYSTFYSGADQRKYQRASNAEMFPLVTSSWISDDFGVCERICGSFTNSFYPRPVCLCVCVGANHEFILELVYSWTCHPFKLESPNLNQKYKTLFNHWIPRLNFAGVTAVLL